MSTLDDLLSDLEAPVVSKTKPVATKPVASKPVASDDLDSLLADLGGAKPAAKTAVATKPKASAAAADDLDSLLSDLGGVKPVAKPAAKPVAATPKTASVAAPKPAPPADDLDALLNDLGGAPVKKPATAPTPAKTVASSPAKTTAPKPAAPVDDLDSLMADLGAGAPAPKPVAKVAAPAPKPVASPAKPVDDLDSLMADLGAPAPKPVAKQAAPAPAKPVAAVAVKKTAPPADDLDSLMADLGAPAKSVAPAAAKKVATPAKSSGDDLDALMADLGGSEPAPAKPVAAKKTSGDDLDSLMSDLSVGGVKATASFKVGGSAAAPSKPTSKADELDSLMDSLGGPATPKKASANDLDDLMSSLSSPSTAPARPPAASFASRPPAGSLSRFDDLMSTVTADMNDLTSGAGAKSRGVCYHCRQPIYDECMQALGRTYHPEHFMCGSCNNPLGTGNFFELAGQAHCQRCYQLQFCPKCAHCNQVISDRCVTALDKKWHVHCFVCTQCTSPFTGNFFERDGRPYCDRCFHQVFAPRCRSCNQPVLGDCVNALGAQWHPEHFNCQFCKRAFTGTFFEYEGLPYCEAHYYQKMGSSCSGCQQPISGACVDALGKKWHPEHFVCAFCMNKLEGSSYTEKNSKPYCKGCFGKLFGS